MPTFYQDVCSDCGREITSLCPDFSDPEYNSLPENKEKFEAAYQAWKEAWEAAVEKLAIEHDDLPLEE